LGSTSTAVVTELSVKAQAVLAVLRRLAGPGGEVSAIGTTVTNVPANASQRQPGAFHAKQRFRVLTSDLANAVRLVDAAIAAGATRVQGVSLGMRDEGAAMREARHWAVCRAVTFARVAAAAMKVRPGTMIPTRPVLTVSFIDPARFISNSSLQRSEFVTVETELLQ